MTTDTAPRERPILFSAPMIRAILDGRKTQTRRIVKPQPPSECGIHYMLGNESWLSPEERSPLRHTWEAWGGPLYHSRPEGYLCGIHDVRCPYGVPGDLLWVKETWTLHERFSDVARIVYAASQGQNWSEMHADFPADVAVEDEFLAHTVLPDGSTVGDWAKPQLDEAYRLGRMPTALMLEAPAQ